MPWLWYQSFASRHASTLPSNLGHPEGAHHMTRGLVAALTVAVLAAALLAGACGGSNCGPQNCNGCCDSVGTCQTGDEIATCGTHGGACRVCAVGQACNSGVCSTGGDAG